MTLTRKQRAAASKLAEGATIAATADAVGVHRNTISTWLGQPVFLAALGAAQDDALTIATAGTTVDIIAALTALRAMVDDADIAAALRLRAAVALVDVRLRLLESATFARRLAALETLVNKVNSER